METTLATGAARRRIIKRPLLTRMLDESGARIILLVAPAGYGAYDPGRRVAGREASGLVPLRPCVSGRRRTGGRARSSNERDRPGRRRPMRQRLRATDRPVEDASILAETLAEDLAEWPDDAWLVIDDYHFATESSASEAFVDALVSRERVRLLLTSRRRPSWATARRRIYGEAFEVDRTLLAMSDNEAHSSAFRSRECRSFFEPGAWLARSNRACGNDERTLDAFPPTGWAL